MSPSDGQTYRTGAPLAQRLGTACPVHISEPAPILAIAPAEIFPSVIITHCLTCYSTTPHCQPDCQAAAQTDAQTPANASEALARRIGTLASIARELNLKTRRDG